MTKTLERRESATAPVHTSDRMVAGIAVPYGQEIELAENYYETIAPGAWKPRADGLTGMKLLWRHNEVIGTVTHAENRDEGLYIEARISQTTLGNDVYALLKDRAIDRFSIGFYPQDTAASHEDGTTRLTHRAIDVIEVSLVPWPAYEGATVDNVRHATTPTTRKETPKVEYQEIENSLNETRENIAEVRENLDALTQRLAFDQNPAPAPADTRNAAAVLCDLVEKREGAREAYNALYERAFTGTKSDADPTMTTPQWVADLTRLYNTPDLLKPLFSTGVLPDTGMELEYTLLDTNTMRVAEYEEGSDVVMGKVALKKATAPVKAYAGGTSITRRAIDRTRMPLLQRQLEALSLAAGAAAAKAFSDTLAAAVKKQDTAKLTLSKAAASLTWADLSALIVDAADAYRQKNLSLDGLIVNKATFKALAALTATDGRPLMTVTGNGTNTVGTVNVPGLSGNLVGVKVVPNFVHTGAEMGSGIVGTFFNSDAIRSYESPLVQLQDENILNLSKDFSVYRYAAYAVEVPDALIPLKLGV